MTEQAPISSQLGYLFGAEGPLSRQVPAYKARAQQLEMAQCVAAAIETQSALIAEAGTGTGKTFAYLAPAMLYGGKVIVSTGTKTLQDQLFTRDIPTLRAALNIPITIALLKGRANYVCHYHLERAAGEAQLPSREEAQYLRDIVSFARRTRSGDKGELGSVPEDAAAWQHATSTRENCLGTECAFYKDCFVMKARREAQQADLVVVNHHLFFADLMLRDTGVAELLPMSNTVIFDEAHQLPDVASLFFGDTISSAQLLELARDTRAEAATSAKEFAELPPAVNALEKAVRELRLCFAPGAGARFTYRALEAKPAFHEQLTQVAQRVHELSAMLDLQQERSEGLANCYRRSNELLARLHAWQRLDAQDMVRWVEVFRQALQLHATPISVADKFQAQMDGRPRAWIFTSATLSVEGDFSHFQRQLGLSSARTGYWLSPFDYAQQALLYVPRELPEPNSPEHTPAVVEQALELIAAARGRAFLLFTTLRAMRDAYESLRERFAARGMDYPLLMQGQGSRSELLERFRAYGNAVLVASHTFWEGVDVRGSALVLVLIDKLPFAPPDDPVVAARIESLRARHANAFMDYQLPEAVITLKQGAGRLIRDETDYGVLAICDTRIISKPYGRRVWRSLPPARRSREFADVQAFFAAHESALTQPTAEENAHAASY